MATGPMPLSGAGWNLHKSKEEIFAHLNEHGISMDVAKQLSFLTQSGAITKEHGLALIAAMNTEIEETNVLTSSWDLLTSVAQAEWGTRSDGMEAPGDRLALIPIWVKGVLRAQKAASGFDKEVSQDEETVDIDVPPKEESPPHLPDPPKSTLDVSLAKGVASAAGSAQDREIENLISSLKAAEEKIINSRATLAANAAALDVEANKAEQADAVYRADQAKKLEEREKKRTLVADLVMKLAAAQGLDADLRSQNESVLAAAELARKKQASIVAMMSSMREGPSEDTTPLHVEAKRLKLDNRVESSDALLLKALGGGRMTPKSVGVPPPPPPPPSALAIWKGWFLVFPPCP